MRSTSCVDSEKHYAELKKQTQRHCVVWSVVYVKILEKASAQRADQGSWGRQWALVRALGETGPAVKGKTQRTAWLQPV